MAHAYTPGLKVTEHTVIRRKRILPIPGEVIVRKGTKVAAEAVVARAFLPGKVYPINLANKFAMPPEDVPQVMKVREGDPVERGQILAETPGIFGWFKSVFRSPITGTVESISSVTGQVMLREPPTPIEVFAYIQGIVEEVYPKEGVLIETQGAMIQGIFGIGGERTGEICVAVESPEEELLPDHLTEEMKKKVVIGGSYLTYETYEKAVEVGVSALVVGGFDDHLLSQILGYDIGVAITGAEDIPLTLIMTEGFGRIAMANKTFALLKKLEGKRASVSGATQIRAGVMRPEIIVPLSSFSSREKDQSQAEGTLAIGSLVRVIRNPYFGEIGEVVELPIEPCQIETEAKVRVMKVKLKSGEEITLPRANVELIEE